MDEHDSLAAHAKRVAALRDPRAYAHPVDDVELVETHISSVLLAGRFAYKLKKPVNFGFVDFSTLALRRRYCEEELRLNRRSAPMLYLDVVPVTQRADGGLRFGGDGAALDYAVRMRRFDADAQLDRMARSGRLDAALIDRLAAAIATFHASCEPAPPDSGYGSPERVRAWAVNTLTQLRAWVEGTELRQRIDRLAAWTEAEFARRAEAFAARRAAGFVRECHGDLHLGNMALIDGEPVAFDCIEFNPELRFIDVASDVAFTWMDLIDFGRSRLAARFLNADLEATGDYAGLATLRYYAVYRALVRALVALLRRAQSDRAPQEREADRAQFLRYLAVAESIASPRPALVLATCGVAGSGKTTVAQHLLESLGAVRVRSDVERKRLAGLTAHEHRPAAVGADLYAPATTQATYERLRSAAAAIVDAGFAAIVDATFQRRAERRALRQRAQSLGARFALIVCSAPPAVLRARVAARLARGADASDATLEVLAAQLAAFEPVADDEADVVFRLDTDVDAAALAARCENVAASLS
jgi:aminoglycoside phosphotransferase family enzyme/predicted kinase